MSSNIDNELYDRIVFFLVDNMNCKFEEVEPQSSLYHDLGCDGMDGDKLLSDFRDRFEVDMSGFLFDRHFGPELPFIPLIWLYWRVFTPDKLNN